MKRRDFLRWTLGGGAAVLLPSMGYNRTLDLNAVEFDAGIFNGNAAQTILVFLYGGASQLAGNITNLDTIEAHSQNSYHDYFQNITATAHGCWQEAGGTEMETLLANGDMTLYRTCYSAAREAVNNKAHGVCTEQNQKGSFDTSGGGIVANIATILHAKGAIDTNTLMPFVTMEGESHFYDSSSVPLAGFLKPVAIDEDFDNPYERTWWTVRRWTYYTEEEQQQDHYDDSDENGGFDPALTAAMDTLAQQHNRPGKIKDAFESRGHLADFIDTVKATPTPDLGDDAYPEDNAFADKLEAAIKLLDGNPDTRIVTLGTGGLGGWDDHNEARDYVSRAEALFRSLRSAAAHLKAINKDDTISILVFGEFGRNVNLNSAYGWDHGNLQNLYVFGGKRYFTHRGVVGETTVDVTGSLNRLWLKPAEGSYWFEPLSIAATLYTIFGITNPDVLTGGNYPAVNVV